MSDNSESPSKSTRQSLRTVEYADHPLTITFDVEINVEEGRPAGAGFFCPRPPSKANTMPPHDGPSEERKRPQRCNSLSGADKRTEDEYERLKKRPEELETEVETLQLQVEEGRRGQERLTLEMQRVRLDALEKEIELKIREMERLIDEQNALEFPSVATPSGPLDPSTTTELSNDSRGPDSEIQVEEAHHPDLSLPTIIEQQGLPYCQPMWTPYNVLFPTPSFGDLQREPWIHSQPRRERNYVTHQAPFDHGSPNGWAPSIYPGFTVQDRPPSLWVVPHPPNGRNTPYRAQQPSTGDGYFPGGFNPRLYRPS